MADGKIFDGSDAGKKDGQREHKRPILENNNDGAAAWLHRDKNNNAYFSVKLPLGLGSLNLFPTNDEMADALNQLAEYLDQQES